MISSGDFREESLIKTPTIPQPNIEAKAVIKDEFPFWLAAILLVFF
jgi:hypothetical protein